MFIDLRSDTVTQPSAAMRAAMAAAPVGDDDYREDPTVSKLEEGAAALLGKEAGLFVPSGVMSNLVAALTHCPDDHRTIALTNSHIAWSLSENPRLARLVQLTKVRSDERGLPPLDDLLTALDAPDAAPVGLLCYENTHNQAGGTALTLDETAPLVAAARERGIPIHLDGARIFNAAVALGLPAATVAAEADSATFCVSKGLGAPVGSVLCGSEAFIALARDYRKYLGGTMRQAGVIAAAGLFALETMIDRLVEDHVNARWLSEQLAQIPGLIIRPQPVETNIIFVEFTDFNAAAFSQALRARGVAAHAFGRRIRLVTHVDIDRPMLEHAVAIFAEVATSLSVLSPQSSVLSPRPR